jgi:hypothetical protein
MDSKSLATSFIECFCKADLSGINALLSSDFQLKGPLYEFDSKQAYINSLEGNLEADANAEIISVISNDNEAAAFYRYKGNTIGQLFWCRGGEIYETLLVFDTDTVA